MSWLRTLLVAALFAVSPAQAKERVVANAEADLQRFEQQAQGLNASRKSNVKRILKLLELSHDRLQSAKDKQAPEWRAVDRRYKDLKAQLQTLLQPTANTQSSSPASAQPAKAQTSSADSTPSSGPRPLVSGERVRVKKLTRDMQGSLAGLVTSGPSRFQDQQIVAQRSKRLKQYAEALKRYPQADDPDVQAARKAFQELKSGLQTELQRAKEQMQKLGDVQKRLAKLNANFRQYPVPQPMQPPFTEQQAKAWVKAASNARAVAEHNHKQLAEIAPIAYLPDNRGTPETGAPFDAGDVDRMLRHAVEMANKVQANYAAMAQTLNRRMADIERDVLNRYAKDPQGDAGYQFIGEGSQDRALKLFDDSAAIPRSFVALEQALGRDVSKGSDLLTKLENAREDFLQKRKTALSTSRLPDARSTDSGRLAIAKQILANPKYKFGRHGRIVLTSDEIVSRERKDSEIEIDDAEVFGGKVTFSGTETTWTYRWEEFNFAVPLKEEQGDDWYIWWITAKKFSSGGNRTPLNRWISGGANKGNQILPENI